MALAPILLFTFKRLDTLKQTVEALKLNTLSDESELYIFSDAARNIQEEDEVFKVRQYLTTIDGFKKITIFESATNKGLARSIIDGINFIFDNYSSAIILEDDLLTSKNFLLYLNKSLNFYAENDKVISIAAYTTPLDNPTDDIYFTKRASSWGWATWKDRWVQINWDIIEPNFAFTKKQSIEFNKMGSDMTKMLYNYRDAKIDSWAIRFCYYQYLNNLFTVYPTLSKVKNIGLGKDATNTYEHTNRFDTILDISDSSCFSFTHEAKLNSIYLNQFLKQFSVSTRVKYKILNLINRFFN